MTRKTVSIPVNGGLLVHGGMINAVTLGEPSFDDYLRLGDPVSAVYLGDGNHTYSENSDVIRQYIQCCLIEPKDMLLLDAGGFKLARALKVAVLNFFRDAEPEIEPSKTSETISSGDVGTGASAQTA